jgi:hypothetical protein
MSRKEKYVPTEKAAAFLADVENGKYKREIVTGLAKFIKKEVPEEMQDFYTPGELDDLIRKRSRKRCRTSTPRANSMT